MNRALSPQVILTAGVLCAIALLSSRVRDTSAAVTSPQPASSPSPSVARPAASGTPSTIPGALSPHQVEPISANPGASYIVPGTAFLGHLIGLDHIPGVRLGGLWIGNSDYLFTGGVKPRSWS